MNGLHTIEFDQSESYKTMLTGKAKIHFDVWARQHPDTDYNTYTGELKVGSAYFSELPNALAQAFVLEWLDSVELFVSVIPVARTAEYYYFSEVTHRRYGRLDTWSSSRQVSRQLATKAAIEQAVAIYNGSAA